MKILILQVTNLKELPEYVKISSELAKKYAEINGYDYKFILADDVTKTNSRQPFGLKYKYSLQYIDDYDYILYLDTDINLVNPNKKLEDVFKLSSDNKDYDMFVGQDAKIFHPSEILCQTAGYIQQYLNQTHNPIFFPTFLNWIDDVSKQVSQSAFTFYNHVKSVFYNSASINGGFLLFKSTDLIKDMLSKMIQTLFLFNYEDEHMLGVFSEQDDLKDKLKIMLAPECPIHTKFYYNVPFLRYDVNNSFSTHMCGEPIENRTYMANVVKSNKYWHKYFTFKKDSFLLTMDVALGDFLSTTAFFKDFSEQYPDKKLYFKINSGEQCIWSKQQLDLIKNNPYIHLYNGEPIDQIIDYDTERNSWQIDSDDILITRGLYTQFEDYTGIHVEKKTEAIDVYLTEDEKSDKILDKYNIPKNKPICLISAGYHPFYNSAKFPGTDKYQNIINQLKDKVTFVQVGDKQNGYKHAELKDVISLIDKTSIRELFSLMYNARYVITTATGILHVASIKSIDKKDVFLFLGTRENINYYKDYYTLDHTKYHVFGYDKEKYKFCLCDKKCCLAFGINVNNPFNNPDVTLPTPCKYVLNNSFNEPVPKCLYEIDENEIVKEILKYCKGEK